MQVDNSPSSPSSNQTDIASSGIGPSYSKYNHSRRRLRLREEALGILEDFFQEVSQNPNTAEKGALLQQIKAVPGCEDYDISRMSTWFANRRVRFRLKERKEPIDNSNDPRFPSLTQAAIQHLTVLTGSQPKPSPELLRTWAALLQTSGAKEQDVINWTRIHYQNQEHLPTPEPSATPSQSPTQSAFPLYKQEATKSPVIPAFQLHPYKQVTPSESLPTLRPTSKMDHMSQAIIHGIRDALASQRTPNSVAPKTAAEFEAMFSPFEQRMLLLLRALETT